MAELPHASVRRNLGYALLGNGVLNLCRFGVMLVLANLASAELAGSFHFAAVALSAPIVMFFGLELRTAFVADVRQQFPFGAYRALRTAGMLAALPVMLLALWLTFRDGAPPALLWMMAFVCGGRLALQLAEVDWGLMQRHERFDLIALGNTLRGVLLLAPFAILIPTARAAGGEAAVPWAAAASAAAYLLGWLAVWLLVERRFTRRFPEARPLWDARKLLRLAGQTLPMGLVILLLALCEAVPTWFIKHYSPDLADVGYYGALKIITLGATFLIVQVGNAAGNRLAIAYHSDLPRFVNLAAKLTGLAAALGLALLALTWGLGEWFLHAVYPADFAAHHRAFLILVGAQALFLLGSVFGFVTSHMRRFWIQVPVQLATLAATVIASWALVAQDPVRGAAWAVVVRAAVQTLLYLACVLAGVRAHRAPRQAQR